jgi:hypothetical protein
MIVETSDHIRIEQGIERLLLFERRAAPARPWAPDGLEFDRPTCVTLCYTGLEPATRACDRMQHRKIACTTVIRESNKSNNRFN